MANRERIRGQVARILNSREIAINRGAEDGVIEGMKFSVLDAAGEDIRDPETAELLGSVYRAKVEVKVVVVKEKLSIARTFRAQRVNVGGTGVGGAALSKVFEPPRWETRYETLKTDEKTWEDIDESQSYVKTGDVVEEILEPDESETAGEGAIHATDVGEQMSSSGNSESGGDGERRVE